jgi:hypothetical protein
MPPVAGTKVTPSSTLITPKFFLKPAWKIIGIQQAVLNGGESVRHCESLQETESRPPGIAHTFLLL